MLRKGCFNLSLVICGTEPLLALGDECCLGVDLISFTLQLQHKELLSQ